MRHYYIINANACILRFRAGAFFSVEPLAISMSSSTPQLTSGICERLQVGDRDDLELWDSSPTVQFLSIKKVSAGITTGNSSSTDRFRIIVSDGVHFVQAMLATQLNHLVEEAVISKNTVAKLEKITCNVIQEKRFVPIAKMSYPTISHTYIAWLLYLH